ncbi:MAG: RecQ family ATP-dependent DNA helicase, partial [Tannerellaceae bacterium]
TTATDCGCCDTCLARSRSGVNNYEFNIIRNALLKMLATEPLPVQELVSSLPFTTEKHLAVIRFLADNDPDFQLEDGYLKLLIN